MKTGTLIIIAVANKHYILEYSDGSSELYDTWDGAYKAGGFIE